ncbi:hypothetical protein BH23CHL3_BH23CHL3_11130 [soil metagenome]
MLVQTCQAVSRFGEILSASNRNRTEVGVAVVHVDALGSLQLVDEPVGAGRGDHFIACFIDDLPCLVHNGCDRIGTL